MTALWTPASMGHEACANGCPPPSQRPYARKKVPSVTTLIGVMDKPGLAWGAAKETAVFAFEHRDKWERLDKDDAVERLRKHHRGVWDASAKVGNMCHAVAEAWSYGRNWEAPDDLEPELFERMGGYVAGLEAFFADNTPEVIATELIVAGACDANLTPEYPYVGTADWITKIGDDVWLLDIKTTNNLDESKQFYTKEWRLQLAAYRWANEVVHYHGGEEVTRWPIDSCVPRPTRTGIVHMRGNGGYQLIEVATPIELLSQLQACAVIHKWGLTGGHATPAPIIAKEHRA